MNDLISRQEAIDAIDILKRNYPSSCFEDLCKAVDIAIKALSAQPEVIRCKDCKYKYVDGDNVKFNLCALNHNKVQSDDWYCADAEREEHG